ncbi:MAG: rRNA pseudouridine synthase [Bacteroidetes bacterium]|nr:rRNA pseudouridine synthase [Bacteroidota bacterium]
MKKGIPKKKSNPSGSFSKFHTKKSNAAIKEQFKQEKRQWKKEREDFFDERRKSAAQNATTTNPKAPKYEPRNINQELMPLNKFIAHSGVAARREAAEMVKQGLVKVNGNVITEPGHKVSSKDDIRVKGKKISIQKDLVYILLNKPKDYITTTDDPQGRKTVLDLIRNATSDRVYPIGRLDRNTSGVLLFTNDGELAQKLTHPRNEIKKVYQATLNKPLEKNDFDAILKGLILEDGPAPVDVLAYSDLKDKTQVGIEIHSGRNRIVRRIFEHLGYDVKNLDRVTFAGLTKKNVDRGKWRFLTEKEVRDLKYFGKGKR